MDKDAAGSDLPGVQAPVAELAEGVGAAPDGAFERILEIIQAGGPVVLLLIAVSIVATAVILLKIWQFSRTNVGKSRNGPIAVQLYKEGRVKEALAAARRARSPVGEVLARAMRGRQRNLPEAKIREEVLRYGGDVLESLRGGFRILEVIASLSPLLGLFGTVLGMIEAFRALEAAGNQINPAILSGGIWQALLTTAVGLAIAIPVVAILNWLERRVDGLAHEMDNLVTQLFTEDLSGDASLEGVGHRDRTDFAAAVA